MNGQRIKEKRELMHLTQSQLAKQLDTSRSNVANWENNQNNPSLDMLFKLSNLFNCSVEYLAGQDESISQLPEPYYEEKEVTISSIKNDIMRIPPKELKEEYKGTLTNMVDYYHNLSVNKNNEQEK